MSQFRRPIYAVAGYNTTYFGPGRQEFKPDQPMRPYEEYLKETAEGTAAQIPELHLDEGVIGSFMAARFLNQANLPALLPFMQPALLGKPCTAVEGACGTGGRAIATGIRSVLSGLSDSVFVAGFEIQNRVKALYGADILAGAAYYNGERKRGHAFFFPGIFSERAGAYYAAYGYELSRKGMAHWYQQSVLNARKHPKAQEFHNKTADLLAAGMTPPDANRFVPHLNLFDCSKVTDGASSIVIMSEEGLARSQIPKSQALEIIAIGEAEDDLTRAPADPTKLATTALAVQKALQAANLTINEIGLFEIHDCFSITALLTLEAMGLAKPGEGAHLVAEGQTAPEGRYPVNVSGGLHGFGHPTGASGVRQLVDLLHQLTGSAVNPVNPKAPYGLMISMGGNDKTVTAIIVKKAE